MSVTYKVVEVSPVDERGLETALNAWSHLGWRLDRLQFVMMEGVRRPSLAYVILCHEDAPASGAEPISEPTRPPSVVTRPARKRQPPPKPA